MGGMGDANLRKILLDEHYVEEADLAKADEYVKRGQGTIADYLIGQGILNLDLLGQAMAESFGVPYADLNSSIPPREQVLKVPEAIAKKLRIVLFTDSKTGVTIATDDPARQGLKEELAKLFPDRKAKIAYSLPEDIDATFGDFQQPLDTRFSEIIKGGKRVAPEVLDQIFGDALSYRASDIHFEPQGKESVMVRFRVDGVLHEAGKLPREYYENVLNRIKVQSRLRIDEHAAAQDGSMRHEKEGVTLDIRTSIVPTVDGEKVVLRLLATYVKGLSTSDLGLSPEDKEILERAADKPFGMILVVGPTGSGKTTTLYALLRTLNQPDVNVTTIEDPVEYKMPGLNQIQVNPETDLTFAKGLRSIVRQDPDIILVGEIRDRETVEIAVNAALTGHLLLSTFHANDAATAVPRLLDMEAEPFLLSSTLQVVVAQRLVRKLCERCRVSSTRTAKEMVGHYPAAAKYFAGTSVTLYEGKGCDACGHTGYRGRMALFEVIRTTPELQELILRRPSAQQIWELARKQGSRSMFDDGVAKVKAGVTSLEELLRVAEPPDEGVVPAPSRPMPAPAPEVSPSSDAVPAKPPRRSTKKSAG